MPAISGLVNTGQDPATRIQNVIDSAFWIQQADMALVLQGKQEVLDKITNESWEPPFVWRIRWVNTPPQEAEQWVETEMENVAGMV